MCRILPQIEDERVAVHNLHISSDMDSREGIVPGDHDACTVPCSKHRISRTNTSKLARCDESLSLDNLLIYTSQTIRNHRA